MNYRAFISSDTFVGRYMDHMQNQETATDYDFWCALWLLSIACGRHVIVDRPRAPVFLNLYAILVAESGITRKSSAVRSAAKIANELLSDNPHMGMLESKTTPEKLDDMLHRRAASIGSSQLCIAVSELAVFLGVERYNATMPALLTDLYDCPSSRKGGGSVSRGAVEQSNVFISFLSASTPAWLHRSVNPNIVEGGFTSRCLFIVSEEAKRRIAWPDAATVQDDAILLVELRKIKKTSCELQTITLNDGALKKFRGWYGKRQFAVDAFRASFESREDAHVLRVAAFLCINDGTWVIQSGHINTAIRLVEDNKLKASRLFAGTNRRSKFVLGLEAIRDALLVAAIEPLPRSKLYLKCRQHVDNAEFSALLDVMHEIGAIQRFEVKHEGAGRPVDLIRATKLLQSRGMTERIMERFT